MHSAEQLRYEFSPAGNDCPASLTALTISLGEKPLDIVPVAFDQNHIVIRNADSGDG